MAESFITDEAVEAASQAIAFSMVGLVYMSAVADGVIKGEMRDALDTAARAALEAALPLIVREAKVEALEEAADAMGADPSFRDPLRLKSDWLRARAARIRGGAK